MVQQVLKQQNIESKVAGKFRIGFYTFTITFTITSKICKILVKMLRQRTEFDHYYLFLFCDFVSPFFAHFWPHSNTFKPALSSFQSHSNWFYITPHKIQRGWLETPTFICLHLDVSLATSLSELLFVAFNFDFSVWNTQQVD